MYSTAAALEFVDIHRSQSIQRAQSASATDAAESAMKVDDERWWRDVEWKKCSNDEV